MKSKKNRSNANYLFLANQITYNSIILTDRLNLLGYSADLCILEN